MTATWRDRLLERDERLWRLVREQGSQHRVDLSPSATYVCDDALHFMTSLPSNSMHAIVTDPPYRLIEYQMTELAKRKNGKGGVWRSPPSFDGSKRSPLPRFTVLSMEEITELHRFFSSVAAAALAVLVPGGHLFIASNPLLSTMTFHAFQQAGFEKRGEVICQTQTLRGGDRPKGAEHEFSDVSVMARSCWEPWGIFRKPCEDTVAKNLKLWGAGGLRRISPGQPFKDLIPSSPTGAAERKIAPHPSLKPQRFVRQIVRAALPLGLGTIYDPFAGSGTTLAAAHAVGYRAIGTDHDLNYLEMSRAAFDGLINLV